MYTTASKLSSETSRSKTPFFHETSTNKETTFLFYDNFCFAAKILLAFVKHVNKDPPTEGMDCLQLIKL